MQDKLDIELEEKPGVSITAEHLKLIICMLFSQNVIKDIWPYSNSNDYKSNYKQHISGGPCHSRF